MARKNRGQFPKPRKENGNWKITYREYLASGVRKRTKCLGRVADTSFAEARNRAQTFLEPINRGSRGSEFADRTMDHLTEYWRTVEKSNLKRSTQDSYQWAIKRILPAFTGAALRDITKPDVQAFLVACSRELSPNSVYDLKAHFSGLLTLAEEIGWIVGNPARGRIRLPPTVRARLAVRKKVVLTPDQFRVLVEALRPPYRTVVTLAVLSGLRRGELAALRWNDVSIGTVVVDEAIYRGILGTPKGHRPERTTRIGEKAYAAILEWKAMAPFTGPDDFLFGIQSNTPIDMHNALAREVKPACRRLGIPVVSWHDLRHTYATWGRQAGVSPEVMQQQLGHASIETTLGIYSHLAAVDDTAAAAVEGFAYGVRVHDSRVQPEAWMRTRSTTAIQHPNATPNRGAGA
jgi:integrase